MGASASRTEKPLARRARAGSRRPARGARARAQRRASRGRHVEQRHRRAQPPGEPASRADVRLARLADGRADEDALELARPSACQQQRRRASPRALRRGRRRAGPHGRTRRRRRRRSRRALSRLLGGDLLAPDRRAARGSSRPVKPASAARLPSVSRSASCRRASAVTPRTVAMASRAATSGRTSSRAGAMPSSGVADEAAAASAAAGCATPASTTQGSPPGRSRVRRRAASSRSLSSPNGSGGASWRMPGSGGQADADPAQGARRSVCSTIVARGRGRRVRRGRLRGDERDLLGPDEHPHAGALLVRDLRRDRQRQRAELDAVVLRRRPTSTVPAPRNVATKSERGRA